MAPVEQHGNPAAAFLGLVKGIIGSLKQTGRVVVIGVAFGKPCGSRQIGRLVVQIIRLGQGSTNRVSQRTQA